MIGIGMIGIVSLLAIVPVGAIFIRLAIALLNVFLPKYVVPETPGDATSGPIDSGFAITTPEAGLPDRDLSNPFSAPVEMSAAADPYAADDLLRSRGNGAVPRVTFVKAMGLVLLFLVSFVGISMMVRALYAIPLVNGIAPSMLVTGASYFLAVVVPSVIVWRMIPTKLWHGVAISLLCYAFAWASGIIIAIIIWAL